MTKHFVVARIIAQTAFISYFRKEWDLNQSLHPINDFI
jgi:hypothetical protein